MDEFLRSISGNRPEDFRTMLASDPRLANARNGDGVSAVLWSLYWHRQDLAEELIANGADCMERTEAGLAPGQVPNRKNVPEVDALLARCQVS